jgi:ferredoxin-NADP reductase
MRIRVKRYATGKAHAYAIGDPAFAAQAEKALQRSLVIEARVDRERFTAMMAEQGVPADVTAGYLERLRVEDEAWLQDVMPE